MLHVIYKLKLYYMFMNDAYLSRILLGSFDLYIINRVVSGLLTFYHILLIFVLAYKKCNLKMTIVLRNLFLLVFRSTIAWLHSYLRV